MRWQVDTGGTHLVGKPKSHKWEYWQEDEDDVRIHNKTISDEDKDRSQYGTHLTPTGPDKTNKQKKTIDKWIKLTWYQT